MAPKIPRIPPMAEMIEDYGSSTKDICVLCRSARPPRYNFMQQVVVEDETPKKLRESFRVCPYCDVDEDARALR